MRKKLFDIFYPLLSVWTVAVYLQIIHCLYRFGYINLNLLSAFILFLPIIPFEYFATKYFYLKYHDTSGTKFKERIYFFYISNLAFWLVIFFIWDILLCIFNVFRPYASHIQWLIFLLIRTMGWLFILDIIACGSLYYFVTIRKHRMRILTSLILPVVITSSLFIFQITYGNMTETDSTAIELQAGVKKILDADELKNVVKSKNPVMIIGNESPPIKNIPAKRPEVVYVPRGIVPDDSGKFFIAYFGCTFCEQYERVAIVRKDLTNGEILYTSDINSIRNILVTDKTIIFAPYLNKSIYELSKYDLTPLRVFPRQVLGLDNWLPLYIHKDISKNIIYILIICKDL